jgi:hypothetical protein
VAVEALGANVVAAFLANLLTSLSILILASDPFCSTAAETGTGLRDDRIWKTRTTFEFYEPVS